MEDNLKKLETQNRRLKVLNVITIIGLLVALVIVFTTNTEVMKDNKNKVTIIEEKENENNLYQSELSNTNSKLSTAHTELEDIKTEISVIENTTRNTKTKNALRDLAKHIDTLSMITVTTNDTINVFYFKRRKDNNTITNVIENLDFVNYDVIRKTPTTNINKANNVVYYGKFVPKPVVDTLVKHLRGNGMDITQVKPFIMGFDYKHNALEIGYQKEDENTIINSKYHINLLCYRPNAIKKNDMALLLADQGYEIEILPDLVKNIGFNFNASTIIYYGSNGQKAREIKNLLDNKLDLNFLIKKGDNLGTDQTDRNSSFIIQYKGTN